MDVGSFLRGLAGGQALNSAKDRLLATGARAHFNKLIERYGTLLELQLNTVARSLSLTLQLKGEQTPVEIRVHEYTLSSAEGKSVLVIDGKKVDTSREWLTELIQDRVGEKRLVVPDNLEWVVQLLR
jgi:ribose 1,5-bisphosphokinase PhnN